MNVTIELSDEQAAAIKAQAAARGLSIEAWLQEVAAQQVQPRPHIADLYSREHEGCASRGACEAAGRRCKWARPLYLWPAEEKSVTRVSLIRFTGSPNRPCRHGPSASPRSDQGMLRAVVPVAGFLPAEAVLERVTQDEDHLQAAVPQDAPRLRGLG